MNNDRWARPPSSLSHNEIVPHIEEIDKQNFELVVEGMKKRGELGLLMMDAPEEYGGLELDKASTMLVSEKISFGGSFSVALLCPLTGLEPCRWSITAQLHRKKNTWKKSLQVSGVQPTV